MNTKDEILDLVDMNDHIVGTITRNESTSLATQNGTYVRCVSAFIRRPNGDVWVPTRSAHKQLAPNGLDYSCAGYVHSGETYQQALSRELLEETGLVADAETIHLVSKHILAGDPPFFETLYLVQHSEQPQLSDEHTSGKWMKIGDLKKLLLNGAPAKSSLLHNTLLLQDFKGV